MAELQKKVIPSEEQNFEDNLTEWPDWEDEEEPQKSNTGNYLELGANPRDSVDGQATPSRPNDIGENPESIRSEQIPE